MLVGLPVGDLEPCQQPLSIHNPIPLAGAGQPIRGTVPPIRGAISVTTGGAWSSASTPHLEKGRGTRLSTRDRLVVVGRYQSSR